MALANGLQSSSSLLQFIEHNNLVVFTYDLESQTFGYLNAAFEAVFMFSRESVDMDALLGMVHLEDQPYLRQTWRELLAGERIKTVEFRVLLPDSGQKWLLIRPLLLKDQSGQRTITGSVEDITDWKNYAETQARHANKKNAILAILSHDLAGPLGNIQALSAMMATRVKAYQDPHLEELVGIIGKASRQGVRLIQEFIQEEFLESSEAALIKGRADLVKKIQELIEQYQKFQQNTAKTFQLVTSEASLLVEIDEVKFIQVITNLISNAIKFTADNGIITVHLEDKSASVLIRVADNGIGIPRKYHATLFDKFTKARRPGLRGEESVGLGMSIIKTIVEWHDGQIWFESEENQGTTFYLEIPK